VAQYLDFKKISQAVKFSILLDYLSIPYTEVKGELKGEGFIVNIGKNLFFDPNSENKGGPINFLANHENIDLRTAAKKLQDLLLKEPKKPKRDLPELELHYCKELEDWGISEAVAKDFEAGLVKVRSIMAGKVAFKLYDEQGKHVGYIGYDPKGWFYPKGFKAGDYVYNLNRRNGNQFAFLVSSPLEVLKMQAKGHKNTIGLLSSSMSDRQLELISSFKYIYLVHPKPDNIILRLSKFCYCKAGETP